MTAKATNKTEEVKAKNEIKECFIITPIGGSDSEIFRKTEGLISSVLKPVLEKFNFIPMPAHHINEAGSINKQIIQRIINSELVIANLTNINPNVMYELAIRHAFGKKVITMAEHGTKLPFDIVDQRTIFYDDSMIGVEIVKPKLEIAINSILNDTEIDLKISNPIFDAINQFATIQNLPADQQDGFVMLMNRLDKIENFMGEKSNRREGVFLKTNNYVAGDTYQVKVNFQSEHKNRFFSLLSSEKWRRNDNVFQISPITTIKRGEDSEMSFTIRTSQKDLLHSFTNEIANNGFANSIEVFPVN
ncbi:hypothetical protein [Sphingobacterium kitahiroshimense]|uniref:hypothetical protein n=1 Tax=Sphingobacterium kitahiroshimense TaxID=470446 RepID=UPI0032080EA4